jgi:hypothetical protein
MVGGLRDELKEENQKTRRKQQNIMFEIASSMIQDATNFRSSQL